MKGIRPVVLLGMIYLSIDGVSAVADTVDIAPRDGIVDGMSWIHGFPEVRKRPSIEPFRPTIVRSVVVTKHDISLYAILVC